MDMEVEFRGKDDTELKKAVHVQCALLRPSTDGSTRAQ